jgi:hypothetical protein
MQLTAPHATLLIHTGRAVRLIALAYQAITISDRRNVFNVQHSVSLAHYSQITVLNASIL